MIINSKVELENLSIAYKDQGKGKPIVLIHGFMGSHAYWEKVIPKLAEDYRVIAVDLPGHGDSTAIKEEHSIEDYADVLKDFLDQLNIKQITLFGHSLGGYITLAFAERYSNYINGFSLIHSTAYPDSEEAKKGRVSTSEKVKNEGVKNVVDGLIPKLFSPKNIQTNSSEINQAKQIGYKTSVVGTVNALVSMKNRPDRNHVLNDTSLPVLLLAGKDDQIIPPEKTFSVEKENIKTVTLNNAGHMSMYESPEELINEMKNFLSSF
ncbi:alpha/beta fold hydrolase [Gottfriedia acidiceleris]|uniref:Alpha/beta hydrolase n=1 Tax=Gottfriedia acidiceleris TaxID=371036 RepID=A0ABY4JI88_9BACI|nr:alpha/beta hydrolase [Gottfriedia acidiceleris]UPM53331.1 alpha/beta hydrolase [Gottfriedia acidiceleris]